MSWAGTARWIPFVLVVAVRCATLRDPLTNDESGSAVVGRSWLLGDAPRDAMSAYGAYWFDRPPLLPLLYGVADLAGGAIGVRLLGMAAALALVFLIARSTEMMAGRRAATFATFVAAALVVAAPMQADRAYGELFAAVPATLAAWMLVRICAREAGTRDAAARGWWTPDVRDGCIAGVAAVVAVLVKQSALDALVIAAVLLAARHLPRRAVCAGIVGMLVPVALTAAWMLTASAGPAAVVDAVIGFRLEQLGGARAEDAAPLTGMVRLALPALLSGMVIAAAAAVVGIWRVVGWRRLVLVAWFAGALLGVLGGGFYWPHYLIQLIAPIAVAAGIAFAAPGRVRRAGLVTCGVLVVLAIVGPALRPLVPHTGRFDARAQSVGQDVARRGAEDDEILVLTARPGVVHASGLRSASPWLWEAMIQTRPGVGQHLLRVLESRRPPRWVVTWDDGTTRFDEHARIQAAVHERYTRVAVHGFSGVWQLR